MAENNPEAAPKITILNARGEEITKSPVTPRQVKKSLRKKIAYGAAAVGAAATMIAGGIAIEKSGKFSIGATGGESPSVSVAGREVLQSTLPDIAPPTPISERAARKTEVADAETRAALAEEKAADDAAIRAAEERIKKAQEAPKPPAPTETPTDQQKKDAKVAENLGKEMARLQFEYDKAHPSPAAPIATPPRALSGEKPGQGNEEGGVPWGDLFLVGGAAAAMYWLRDGIRTQGGRLITAIKNRFAPPAPPQPN